MNLEEILTQLQSTDYIFPKKALKEAVKQREKITPYLLKILEDADHNLEDLRKREADMSFLYAMFLLAQFREKLAYPLIVKLISHPEKLVDDVFGDVITEDLSRILASVCGGELDLIKGLIENPDINEFVRSASVESLIILVVQGLLSRQSVIDYFRELFQSRLEKNDSYIWTALVIESIELCPQELESEIRQVFDENRVDLVFVRLEDVEPSFKVNVNQSLAKLRKQRHYNLVNNTITEMEWWACFFENKPKKISPNEVVAPSFSELFKKVNPSDKKPKQSQQKKKGFG